MTVESKGLNLQTMLALVMAVARLRQKLPNARKEAESIGTKLA